MSAAIAAHAAGGIALALLVHGAGLGYVRAFGRRLPRATAYAFGLAALLAASALVLIDPWLGGAASLVLLGAPLLALRGLRLRMLRPLVYSLPPAAALAVVLGFLLHGPTRTRGSNAYGDLVVYVAKTTAATEALHPLRDQLALGGKLASGYAEAGTTFLGGALLELHFVDVFLFHAALLPAFLFASLALSIGIVDFRHDARPKIWPLTLGTLAVAVLAYPTWVTESPVIALTLPLTVPLFVLVREPPPPPALALAAVVVFADIAFTKVLAVVPAAIVLAAATLERMRRRVSRRALAAAVAAAAASAAALVAFLYATAGWYAELVHWKFLPLHAWHGLTTQLHRRDTHAAAPVFEVAGQVLLAAALARARAFAPLAALTASVAGAWFVGGYSFDAAIGVAVLYCVLWFWAEGVARSARLPLAAAAATLAVSAWFRETAGLRVGLVLGVLVAAAVAAALAATVAAARTAALAVAVAGVALGVSIARSGGIGLGTGYSALTPADYDLWHRVDAIVPANALLFTFETGLPIDGRHGWNYYPGVAKRQLYLAGWYETPLQVHRRELARRLRLNANVLSGRLDPRRVPGACAFSAYFAVLERSAGAPGSFRPLYRNEAFTLYRIG